MLETQNKKRKQEPIEPDDRVEYRSIQKKQKKEDKTMGKAMARQLERPLREKGEQRRVAIKRG
jgi:hypothetical protein